MASGEQTESTAIAHPELGQAVVIFDDRSRSRLSAVLDVALVAIGISGVYMGSGDLAHGSAALGWTYVGGGVILILWGIRGIVQAVRRLRNPIRVVVGKGGFEYPGGPGPISWEEVATISDPMSPAGKPRVVRVQLDDPAGFAERNALSPIARYMIRVNKGDLVLGRDMATPVVEVERLMRHQLAEFRRPRSAPASTPVRATAPGGRRPSRKR